MYRYAFFLSILVIAFHSSVSGEDIAVTDFSGAMPTNAVPFYKSPSTLEMAIVHDLIFSTSSSFLEELDESTLSGKLEQEFERNGIVLAQDSSVLVVSKGEEWIIRHPSGNLNLFHIRKNEEKLDIFFPEVCRFTYNQVIEERMEADLEDTEGWVGLDLDFFMAPINTWHLNSIQFMVRGQKGGEDVRIGMKDASMTREIDSVFVGNVSDYLQAGQVATEWQKVIIPFKDFPSIGVRNPLDLSQLACITIQRFEAGAGTIYFDNVCFTDKQIPPYSEEYYRPRQYLKIDFDNLRHILKIFTYKGAPDDVIPSPNFPLKRSPAYNDSKGIMFKYRHAPGSKGYVGVWISLNNPFDVSRTQFLSFYTKGQGDFIVGLNDEKEGIIGQQDFYTTRPVSEYLGLPINDKWKRVMIPLTEFVDIPDNQDMDTGRRIRLSRIQKIAFRIISESEEYGEIYIDEIEIK